MVQIYQHKETGLCLDTFCTIKHTDSGSLTATFLQLQEVICCVLLGTGENRSVKSRCSGAAHMGGSAPHSHHSSLSGWAAGKWIIFTEKLVWRKGNNTKSGGNNFILHTCSSLLQVKHLFLFISEQWSCPRVRQWELVLVRIAHVPLRQAAQGRSVGFHLLEQESKSICYKKKKKKNLSSTLPLPPHHLAQGFWNSIIWSIEIITQLRGAT